MNSQVLATIHIVSASAFLLIYLVKTILIFSNTVALQKFTATTRVIEMIISVLFLVTGIWLFIILGAIKPLQIIKLVCVFAAIPIAIIGFKKMKKGLALFSFILLLLAYGFSDMSKKKPYIPNNVVATDASEQAYVSNCGMCHGADGTKQYRNAPNLATSQFPVAAIPTIIRDGVKKGERGTMPTFAKTLNDDEINAISSYVVTLRK